MSAALQLNQIVDEVLIPLFTRFGFRYSESEPGLFEFTSDQVRIVVSYDAGRSYELDIWFSETRLHETPSAIPFSLAEVFKYCAVPEADCASYIQSADRGKLRAAIENAANCLATHCTAVLIGSERAFERLAEQRNRDSTHYTVDLELSRIRAAAEVAWRARQFSEYVRLLTPWRAQLSAAEQQKVSYAQRHSG